MTTYLFPGQGSQSKGMGENLFDIFPDLVQQADHILGYSIKDLCLQNKNHLLNKTEYTQPALYVVNALSYQQKLKQGKKADYLMGHSLGEYNALQASGAMSFVEGLKLVKKRGELMSKAPKGSMAAVLQMKAADIRSVLDDAGLNVIDIANYNAPSQTVISGLKEDVIKAESVLKKKEAFFVPLNTSGAFHSRYMASIQSEFYDFIKSFNFKKLTIPVVSNVYARFYDEGDDIANILAQQLVSSVKWTSSVLYLLERGESEFYELGIGDVLTKLMTKIKLESSVNVQEKTISKSPNTKAKGANMSKSSEERENLLISVQKQVDGWNQQYPVGTLVKAEGYPDLLETRTKSLLLFGHRAAVYLHGNQWESLTFTAVNSSRAK